LVATVGPDVTSYPLTGLTKGEAYLYRVKSYNATAESPATVKLFKTSTDVVLKEAHIISPIAGSTLSNSDLTIHWEKNDAIRMELSYAIRVSPSRWDTLMQRYVTGTSYTIHDLPLAGEDVQITLTSVGISRHSITLHTITKPIPIPPLGSKYAYFIAPTSTSQLTSDTLSLYWNRNGASTVNVLIYNMKRRRFIYNEVFPGTSASVPVPTEGETLQVILQTSDASGHFKGSVSFYILTKDHESPTNLHSPTNLEESNIQKTTATFTWTDNSDNETGFKVYQGSSTTPVVTLDANVTSYTATGLTPNTHYTYIVKAYNSTGESGAATIAFRTSSSPVSMWFKGIPVPGFVAMTAEPLCTTFCF